MKVSTGIMKKGNDNPFYRKVKLKALEDHGSSANKVTLFRLLDDAWSESEDDLTLRQMFFILIFDIGGITNRDHAIYKGKNVDNGGQSARDQFIWALEWMRANTKKQYYIFLMKDLIRQFVGILAILSIGVKTKKNTTQVIDVTNTIIEHDMDKLVEYYAKILKKSNPISKTLIFKSLTRVNLSTRAKFNRLKEKIGRRPLKEEVLKNSRIKEEFYKKLSIEMDWEMAEYPNNIKFIGLNAEKAKYTGTLESVLFSSGKIKEFDKDEFISWLGGGNGFLPLPAGARRRVRLRLLNKDNTLKGKWKSNINDEDLGTWFLDWERAKKEVQKTERVLVEKERQGTITEDERIKLDKVKKEAKVTAGDGNLMKELETLLTGKSDDTLIHSILSKINMELLLMFIIDISGSMGNNWGTVKINSRTVQAYQVAQLFTTLGLIKMPKSEYDDILMLFGSRSTNIISSKIQAIDQTNPFMKGKAVMIPKLIDRTLTFRENFDNIGKIIRPKSEGTHIDTIAQGFKRWVDSSNSEAEKAMRIEQIQSIPMLCIISDSGFNNNSGPKESLLAFTSDMNHWFGWNGGILIWDIGADKNTKSKFDGIPNVFHVFGWNIGAINSIFKNIHDLDVLDIFTSLQSKYKSNRNKPILKATI